MRWRGFCDELHRAAASELDVHDRRHPRRAAGRHAAHPAHPGHRLGLRRRVGRAVRAGDVALRGPDRHRRRLPGRVRRRPASRRSASGPPCRTTSSQPPSPRATVALLHRRRGGARAHRAARRAARSRPRTGSRRVDEMANEDDEVVEYVRSLEERATETDLSQANGDAIAREFERYLRRRGSSLGLRSVPRNCAAPRAASRRAAAAPPARVLAITVARRRRPSSEPLPGRRDGSAERRAAAHAARRRRRRRAGRACARANRSVIPET